MPLRGSNMKLTKPRKLALLLFPTAIILFCVCAAPLIGALIGGAVLGVFYDKILFADELVL